ncbi:MAG: glycosyltransferase, partial [Lachnospiraceae bacterium]|nr:glycosyltransferase [Lachnospiraceae bacterium]
RDDEIVLSDNIVLHDRISCTDIMDKIRQAKISLCFTPWFKNGCSEKNFDSMLNGALCVTDKGKYLENHYIDGYNIIFFDLSNPTQMAADIKWLLDNPDQASIIAQRGYETASMYDTWENRFDFVYETMLSVVESRET